MTNIKRSVLINTVINSNYFRNLILYQKNIFCIKIYTSVSTILKLNKLINIAIKDLLKNQ